MANTDDGTQVMSKLRQVVLDRLRGFATEPSAADRAFYKRRQLKGRWIQPFHARAEHYPIFL